VEILRYNTKEILEIIPSIMMNAFGELIMSAKGTYAF
jgi:hypothetical protein